MKETFLTPGCAASLSLGKGTLTHPKPPWLVPQAVQSMQSPASASREEVAELGSMLSCVAAARGAGRLVASLCEALGAEWQSGIKGGHCQWCSGGLALGSKLQCKKSCNARSWPVNILQKTPYIPPPTNYLLLTKNISGSTF